LIIVPVTLPAVGSFNWGDALNAAVNALSQVQDAQKLKAIEAGVVGVPLTAAASGTTAVTFKPGRFSSTPIIVATAASNSISYIAGIGGQNVNGFTAIAFHRDGTATTATISVNWIAVATL
jgi:hypothetical protein